MKTYEELTWCECNGVCNVRTTSVSSLTRRIVCYSAIQHLHCINHGAAKAMSSTYVVPLPREDLIVTIESKVGTRAVIAGECVAFTPVHIIAVLRRRGPRFTAQRACYNLNLYSYCRTRPQWRGLQLKLQGVEMCLMMFEMRVNARCG